MNILIPDSWLREYLITDATPQQIKDCLSLCGPSVEKINIVGQDFVYEIEITSNRIDMVSVFGIAREAVAILPRFGIPAKIKPLNILTPPKPEKILPLEVIDPNHLCDRLLAIVMDGVNISPSPEFIRDRLEKSGIRALNNLIDITNYLMLELGHPCHVFDYDRIKTGKLMLRKAKKGEVLITLDNKKCELTADDVIIDDGTGRIIDLPGIMGTANSVVAPQTKRIVFFIESNNPVNIRKTSMQMGLRSVAATINEKHPHPELAKQVFLKGIEMYQKICGAHIAGPVIDIYPNPKKPKKIEVSAEFINERLGVALKEKEIVDILKSLSFDVDTLSHSGERSDSRIDSGQARMTKLVITPPTFRQFDVIIPEDIVEEVARIYGYHNLPSNLMTGKIPISQKPTGLPIEEEIKRMLKYWGHTEIYNYSFISRELIEKAGLKTEDHLKVANPLTAEIEYMRISLIPSMLETIAKNQFYSNNVQLFELAKIYLPQNKQLPDEISILSISNQNSFYDLKGIIETLLIELGITNVTIENLTCNSNSTWFHFWHPQQTISMVANDKIIANLGKIHPTLSQSFQIKNDLFLAVLNVEMLTDLAATTKHYTPIPLYPAVVEDLTLKYPPRTYIGPIISQIYKETKLVKKVEVLDNYKDSITLRITYRDDKRNLKNSEIKTIRQQILQTLKSKYQISLK